MTSYMCTNIFNTDMLSSQVKELTSSKIMVKTFLWNLKFLEIFGVLISYVNPTQVSSFYGIGYTNISSFKS